MPDEPRRHRRYMLLLAAVIVGSAPIPFIGSSPPQLLGIPLWLWWSAGFTVALSAVTAWGILRLWKDDGDA